MAWLKVYTGACNGDGKRRGCGLRVSGTQRFNTCSRCGMPLHMREVHYNQAKNPQFHVEDEVAE